ncbi:CPBP family intramembrane glutamic endopeptidase [Clostridium sp. WILCCON 0269]|uniref:CPBP family intramembrane glutamic endopeptidase n=1 Tax=Candidatus Clostridium eludens TaxID=3381663 RepID=A0ABW8SDA0_9CLOT
MEKNNTKYLFITISIAAILWYVMFVIKPINFWLEMSLSITFLVFISLIIDKKIARVDKITLKNIVIGVLSAICLYMVFYIGNIISGYIFPFKNAQVLSIYSIKTQGNLLWISLLLIFIIGPCEEIYWRGFIQNTLSKKLGENKGYILTALLYSAVHVITGNIMLVIAALVCGIYWGWMYKKQKSLSSVIISHAIWDLTIFVLLPIM